MPDGQGLGVSLEGCRLGPQLSSGFIGFLGQHRISDLRFRTLWD